MPIGLQRRYGQGDLHFVTFGCYHRIPLLKPAPARDCFVEMLGEVRQKYDFLLVGYVVMPDHVHLLMDEPKTSTPSTVIQVLKQRVSRALRDKKQRTTAQLPRQFWERRFYDFNVWSAAKRKEKLDYMHATIH